MAAKRSGRILSLLTALGLAGAMGLGGPLGCGYQPVRYEEVLSGAERIAIQAFSNESFEAGAGSWVTDAVTREFLQRGALRVVEAESAADWVLKGSVDEITISQRSFSSVAFALEYEVRLRISAVLDRKDGTQWVLSDTALQETERYLASADVEVTRTHREEAIRRLAGVLAVRLHDSLYERTIAPPEASAP